MSGDDNFVGSGSPQNSHNEKPNITEKKIILFLLYVDDK